MKNVKLKSIFGLGAALAFTAVTASANIVPTFVSDVGGVYTYTLEVDLGETLVSGNQFCISALSGTLSAVTGTGSWGGVVSSASGCAISAGVPSTLNGPESITWTYSGATLIGSASTTNIATLTFTSSNTVVGTNNDAFGATATLTQNGKADANQGEVSGPLTITGTPEPASLSLIGLGLVGLGLIKRRAVKN